MIDLIKLRAELASPDLDATDRAMLLAAAMRDVLVEARQAGARIGGRDEAIVELHAAGFYRREVLDNVDDALLLLEADHMVANILADAAKMVAGAALALAWWCALPGDAGAAEAADIAAMLHPLTTCQPPDGSFGSGFGVGMIATALVALFFIWLTGRPEPEEDETSQDPSWGGR